MGYKAPDNKKGDFSVSAHPRLSWAALLAVAVCATGAVAQTARPVPVAFRDSAQGREVLANVRSQASAETYRQLAPLESQYAGDVEFDYLLGSAALDSGHFGPAIFALQRAVASSPDFAGARLELAHAYYEAGDNESARQEFLALRKQDPPPAVERAIEQYLDAIDLRSGAYKPRFSGLLEAGGGYDTNANGATDARVFQGFDLNDRSQSQESPYYAVGAAGQVSYPFAPRWRLLGDGFAQQRNYPEASFVDTTAARLGAGIEWSVEDFSIGAVGSGMYVALDGEHNNTNVAVDLQTVYRFADDWQLGVGGRAGALRFADELSNEDVDTFLGSIGLTRSWSGIPRIQLVAAVTAGVDRAKDEDSPFGRDVLGGRISAYIAPRSSILVTASVAVLRAEYDEPFFEGFFQDGTSFALYRDDTQASARLGLDWKDFPARRWAIGTQVTYIDNRSSLSLFEYDRIEAGVMLRREFR